MFRNCTQRNIALMLAVQNSMSNYVSFKSKPSEVLRSRYIYLYIITRDSYQICVRVWTMTRADDKKRPLLLSLELPSKLRELSEKCTIFSCWLLCKHFPSWNNKLFLENDDRWVDARNSLFHHVRTCMFWRQCNTAKW